jgi:hypothetical protein
VCICDDDDHYEQDRISNALRLMQAPLNQMNNRIEATKKQKENKKIESS